MNERKKSLAFHPIEHKRDTYGFVVRPQHLKRYQEYANIFKEEEEERSDRWNNFLERQAFSAQLHLNGLSKDGDNTTSSAEASDWESTTLLEKGVEENDARSGSTSDPDGFNSATSIPEKELVSQQIKNVKTHKIQIWGEIRPSLGTIEQMMSVRVMKSKKTLKSEQDARTANELGLTEDDSEDEFYDLERSDSFQDATFSDTTSVSSDGISPEPLLPWKEELESLVRGGVPMALRGELWQAFVGARVRRVGKYYQDLLATGSNPSDDKEHGTSLSKTSNRLSTECTPELWKGQIEKDLPRTFPGHPALDEDGRNALRRLLTAYARHNPSVGYCQAMNFFAGLLLLLMPEENAFWTLMAIIDDYFDGYYSEEMTESQVDQLVFEELMRERLPTLVNHLDHLGVQVPWFTGPWFLSIFVNMLPWETVFRVWDVLLFEGNRVILFRTALALMELYGPALITTKDVGDAVTLMQSLTSSTFDSSQLVLTASMGYQAVNEARLQELRDKHRPSVIASMEERSKGLLVTRILKTNVTEGLNEMQMNGNVPVLEYDFLNCLTGSVGVHPAPNLHEEVASLNVQIGKVLEEKNSAIIRAEELETALVEMVKQDNRHQLNSKVEMLEQQLNQLQKDLAYKQQQEEAMIQVLMRVEHEQRETEDARILAEQDVTAQKDYAHELQGKYEETMRLIDQMEKRVVMAESMLEATLQYQSGQVKGLNSPRSSHVESSSVQVNQQKECDVPTRKFSLLST